MKPFILFLFLNSTIAPAQVGIGTMNPSNNAVLDVSSTNKGLMLPRIADTSNVANPSAGLIIYNNATKKPTYHNGTSWQTIAAQTTTTTSNKDSITYTITGASGIFTNGTFPVLAISHGSNCSITMGGGGGSSSISEINMTKLLDANSIAVNRAIIVCTPIAGMDIEIKAYHPNTSIPYYSIKIQDVVFSSISVGVSTEFTLTESVSITGEIIGFKDWVNNKSFGYNLETNMLGAY